MSKTGIAVKIRRGDKNVARSRRHVRVRKKVTGTTGRPRLVVTRSSRHVFVQVIDDVAGRTLASASTMEADLRGLEGDKTAKARKVGELVGQRDGVSSRRSWPPTARTSASTSRSTAR